ncbi:hypothetical protein FRB93_003175 [Tulasnella sp. JGI-2019a]|nr:hypothetical protein FRB93_003175 [Tulasnella sp. JGI-2019a]
MCQIFIQQHHIIPPDLPNNHHDNPEDIQMEDVEPTSDPIQHATHQHHGVSLEEVEDEGEDEAGWGVRGDSMVEEYIGAGMALDIDGGAPHQTEYWGEQEAQEQPWAPFASHGEWKFAKWMMKKESHSRA